MPSFCVVSKCINKYNHDPDVSFHKFPNDPEICQKWIEFSGRTGWKPTKWSSICSRHFTKSSFKEYLFRKCLHANAVPSLNYEDEISNEITSAPEKCTSVKSNMESVLNKVQNAHGVEVQTSNIDVNNCESNQDCVHLENNDVEQITHDDNTLEHESDLERLVETLCRLCAGTFIPNQLVCYSSFLNLIIKCFPTLNLENYEYFPKQVCIECREKLISFSIFIDKTMAAQNSLTDKLVHNLPNIAENFFDNKKIMPRIKQEPIVVIKEEKNDKKSENNSKAIRILNTFKDKITFKDSKHCEIIKIVNLNTPLIDLRQHRTSLSPKKRQTEIPGYCHIKQKRMSTPQISAFDDDIEILSPTPLKVEEIIEGDEAEEHRIRQQVPVKIDHNYSRSPFTGKIEILEERVFKTEVLDGPFINSIPSNVEHSNQETNHLCPICNFMFDSTSALKRHNLENHPEFKLKNENYHICTLCKIKFSSVYQFLQHKQVVHEKRNSFKCRYCRRRFVNKEMLTCHIRYQCKILLRYKLHRKEIRKKLFKKVLENSLKYEPQQSNNFSSYNITKGTTSNIRQLIEEASKKDYLYIDKPLVEDIVISKPEESNSQTQKDCLKCGRSFSKQSVLNAHCNKHRPFEQWDNPCRFCPLIFDHPSDLNWHVQNKCKRSSSASSCHTYYSCSMCDTTVSSLWSLKNHENIHTKKILYKCKFLNCQKSFVSKQNLTQHSLTHKTERNYSCHLCNKSYKRANGLTQHIKGFHLNVRPYICQICSKSYSLKTDMIRCKHSLLKYSEHNFNT